jgi:GxxExxY protein
METMMIPFSRPLCSVFSGEAVGLVDHPTNSISDKVIGAAIEVHRHLGPGLLESSYHACLCHELELRKLACRSRVSLPLEYQGMHIARGYVIDLLIEDSVIVEIKSVAQLLPIHSAQLMTYMRLQRVSSGLLMNFNVDLLPHVARCPGSLPDPYPRRPRRQPGLEPFLGDGDGTTLGKGDTIPPFRRKGDVLRRG